LLCDITLCSDTTKFFEGHLEVGLVPGDGQFLVFQKLLGLKRANWYMYTAESFDANQALEWGVVNEVVPKEKLIDRAWEMAEKMMKLDRVTRRVTAAVARRYWKRIFTDDFSHHVTSEMYAMMTSEIKNHGHGDQDLPEIFDDLKK
jgi:enoyl-CoA hydratase/carnithine racemase